MIRTLKINRGVLVHAGIAAVVLGGVAAARQQGSGGGGAGGAGAPPAHPEVTEYLPHLRNMDEEAAMAKFMAAMQPGKPHEFLAKMVGEWDGAQRVWPVPGQEPMESKTSATFEMMLGGRFVQSRTGGDMMGMPWEGFGLTGFSNMRNMFVGIWANSMDTDIMWLSGSLDKGGTMLTMIGVMNESTTGEIGKPYKLRWTISGPESIVFELFDIVYGEEWRVVEVKYTRKK